MNPPAGRDRLNPFPGLRPFRADEEYLFFGREKQVDAMVDKLAKTRFLAVVGTSGSGKSSLVNCGLHPALHLGLLASAGTAWRIAQFRPGSNPIRAMAEALATEGVLYKSAPPGRFSLAEVIETTLRMSKMGLLDAFEQAPIEPGANLLVVADQFEELFRYEKIKGSSGQKDNGLGEEATAFVNLLLEPRMHPSVRIYVVLTMRSDFLGDCAQFSGLPEAINAGQYLVPRMTRDERRLAVEGPIGVGGARITPVLLTRLVNDVGDNPDQLSILQHALNRTWAAWEKEAAGQGPLDLRHYEAVGTMANALDQHAEEAFSQLGGGYQQRICEKVFKALTDVGTDFRGIRRPTRLSTLCDIAGASEGEVKSIIEVFRHPSRSFLMPPAPEPLRADTVIDISHESLMRVWKRLKGWTEEEARSASNYRRLAETAELNVAGRANLLRNPELQLALDWQAHEQPNEAWAAQYRPDFKPAMQFLRESATARDVELAAARRRAWLLKFCIGSVVVTLAIALSFYVHLEEKAKRSAETAESNAKAAIASKAQAEKSADLAYLLQVIAEEKQDRGDVIAGEARQNARVAEEERKKARSRELTVSAEAAMNEDPERAVLLALEGLQRADTSNARSALVAAAQYAWPSAELDATTLFGTPAAVVVSPDGSRLAVLTAEESPRRARVVTLWDVTSRSPSLVWRQEVSASSTSLAFSPDQELLAVANTASIDLRDTRTGKVDTARSIRAEEGVGAIAFSPDGQWLAWALKNEIWLRDYRNEHAEVLRVPAKDVVLFAVIAHATSIRIIAVTSSLTAHRIDGQAVSNSKWTNTSLVLSECLKPHSVSPGAQSVSATWKARACAADAAEKSFTASLHRDRAEATDDIVWSAAGQAFAELLSSRDLIVGRMASFDAQSGSRIKGTRAVDRENNSQSISMSEDGTRVALIDRDQMVRVYSLADYKPFLSRFEPGSVAVAPDSHWMAVAKRPTPTEKRSVIDVIPIEQTFASDPRSQIRKRIEVVAPVKQIYAARDSVVVLLETTPETTAVYDAISGKLRFEPENGHATVLGAARELLLFARPWRVIKTRDGSRMAPWGQSSGAGRPSLLLFSSGNEALAFLRLQAANSTLADATVYSVRGDTLVPSGQVVNLPAKSFGRLYLAADARSITEDRPTSDGKQERFVWTVTRDQKLAAVRAATATEIPAASVSPSGRFEIQGGNGAFKVVRRIDRSTLKSFWLKSNLLYYRFSGDDRWLAVWSEKDGIQILDLARGEIVLALDPRYHRYLREKNKGEVAVDFEGRNTILSVQVFDDTKPIATMLIPLDRPLMERFARWLVPRELTAEERCRYELGGEEECRKGRFSESTSP